MILIFIITTAIIALTITGFIMEIHRLQNEVEKNHNAWVGSNATREILEDKLAFTGKNYIDKTNYLKEEIKILKEKNKKYAKRIKNYKKVNLRILSSGVASD